MTIFGVEFNLGILFVTVMITVLFAVFFYFWIKYSLQFKWIGANMRECRQCGAIQNFVYSDEQCAGYWHEQGIIWEDGTEEKIDRDCLCHKYESNVWE